MTAPPKDSIYSGIVTLRSLRLCMFLGELNGLDVNAADVGNAYIMAYTKEKLYIVAGPELGNVKDVYLSLPRLSMDFVPVGPGGTNSLLILSWIWDSTHTRLIQMSG